jgi:hypothetical protein
MKQGKQVGRSGHAAAHPGGVDDEEQTAEEVADVEEEGWPGGRRRWRGRARAAAVGARLREDVQDEEEDDAVPFPCSGRLEVDHGDGGG